MLSSFMTKALPILIPPEKYQAMAQLEGPLKARRKPYIKAGDGGEDC